MPYIYDAELSAAGAVLDAVKDLQKDERARIFAWVGARCDALACKAAEVVPAPLAVAAE